MPSLATSSRFDRFAERVSRAVGHPVTFFLGLSFVLGWLCSGRMLGYSDSWHLILNSPTTAFTFLIALVIESTARRNNEAMHQKLDELIRALEGARNEVMGVEKVDSGRSEEK